LKEKKMKKCEIVLTFCAVLTSFVTTSIATPIQWLSAQGGNDHCYEAFTPVLNWYDAEAIAEASVFLGYHGYLATITSQGETDFIVSNFPGGYCWLGGFQPPGSPEPDGGWQWVTGESWGPYTNWAVGEPSNMGEDGLILWPDGTWNDGYRAGANGWYIVEYSVPEPATLLLFGLGGLILRRKK
jgi:hypothetical protein